MKLGFLYCYICYYYNLFFSPCNYKFFVYVNFFVLIPSYSFLVKQRVPPWGIGMAEQKILNTGETRLTISTN